MNYECFLYDVKENVLVITMNRPEVRNAWNRKMHEEYLQILHRANQDDSIRAVILTGTPPAFSSGTDLKSFSEGASSFESSLNQGGAGQQITLMHEFKKPLIAAINGAAVGMGITPITCCSIMKSMEAMAIGIISVIQHITTTTIRAMDFNPTGVKVPETGRLDMTK